MWKSVECCCFESKGGGKATTCSVVVLRGPVSVGLRALVSPDSMLNSKTPSCVRCNILADCYRTAMLRKNIVVQCSVLLGLHMFYSVVCCVAGRIGCVCSARRTESVPIANSGGQAALRVARSCHQAISLHHPTALL